MASYFSAYRPLLRSSSLPENFKEWDRIMDSWMSGAEFRIGRWVPAGEKDYVPDGYEWFSDAPDELRCNCKRSVITMAYERDKRIMSKTELQAFEDKHMMAFIELSKLEKQVKELEARKNEVRDALTKAMEESSIVSVDNQYVKLVYIAPSQSRSIDTKSWRNADPKVYNAIMDKYPKITDKKGHVRITAK